MSKFNSSFWLAVLAGLLAAGTIDAIFMLASGIGFFSGLIILAVFFAGGYAFKNYKEVKK